MNAPDEMMRLRQALGDDPDTAAFADRIRMLPGDPWRIEGEVETIAARRKAVRLARRALPALEIEDGVRLAPEIRRSDSDLAAILREALRSEPALPGVHVIEPGAHPPPLDQPWIGVTVQEGIIYLGGWLDGLAAKAVVEGLAWETGACRDVKNLICHELRSGQCNEATAEALRILIHEHPELSGVTVEVEVEHSEVWVKGIVSDANRRQLIHSLCWAVPAVRDVHDLLEVAG